MQQTEAIKGDSFYAVVRPGESLYKEKGSKFIGFAFPVYSLEEVNQQLGKLRKQYHDARHVCYAFRLNPTQPEVRASDDGEPGNSAGIPIYNQLLSYEVWNSLVAVVRYFGGTKLGVGGLVQAYKQTAQEALANAVIEKQFLWSEFSVTYPYALTSEVMHLIKEHSLRIIEEQMTEQGGYKLAVRLSLKTAIFEEFEKLYGLKLTAHEP